MMIISVNNECTRKLRNNLRKILLYEAVRRQDLIREREESLLFFNNGRVKTLNDRTNEEEESLIQLQDEWWVLERLKRKSICECAYCGDNESDMVFIPDSSNWICVTCAQSRGFI